jgi:hypothetical protein
MRTLFFISVMSLCACENAIADRPIASDSVNLSSAELAAALASSDREAQEQARVMLLGVLDATEGRDWCGYARAKTASLQEIAYEALRASPPDSRAATRIVSALASRLPCEGTR